MQPLPETALPEDSEAENALARSLLRALPFPVFALDSHLSIIYANADWQQFVGAGVAVRPQREDLFGLGFLDCLPPTERGHWERTVREVLANADPAATSGQVQEIVCPADPEPRLVRVMVEPYFRRDGSSSGLLLTSHDMTLSARAAGDHADAGEHLEATGREVARQIAATLNHEINNPLFVISATLEDLLAESEDPGDQRRLRASLDAVWRVASAVKQLQEIRQLVPTSYIPGFTMLDLEASQVPRKRTHP